MIAVSCPWALGGAGSTKVSGATAAASDCWMSSARHQPLRGWSWVMDWCTACASWCLWCGHCWSWGIKAEMWLFLTEFCDRWPLSEDRRKTMTGVGGHMGILLAIVFSVGESVLQTNICSGVFPHSCRAEWEMVCQFLKHLELQKNA